MYGFHLSDRWNVLPNPNISRVVILRIPQVGLDYRYPKYHNFSNRSFFADMLDICNDKLTGAKDGGNDSDRNHLRPSEAPGYMALFQPFGI
jgi:hypothetical protein